MADWDHPVVTDDTDDVLDTLKERDVDAITLCLVDPTNKVVGTIRWNRATLKFQEWDGAAWNDLTSSLGTMAEQDSDNVSITGGTIGGAVNIDASRLTSGIVPAARLGSGTPTAFTPLFGDGTWKEAGIGIVHMWMTGVPPTGYLLLNGQLISRTTYASLFALWGTTYGVGNGTTTFGIPDMRGYFPFGKAASGTGSGALGSTFGAIDHTHAGPSHTHASAAHVHALTSHTHTYSQVIQHTHDVAYYDEDVLSATPGPLRIARRSASSYSFATETVSGGVTTGTTDGASGSSDSTTPGDTGAAGTGVTSANNPPGFVVNFIVKAL